MATRRQTQEGGSRDVWTSEESCAKMADKSTVLYRGGTLSLVVFEKYLLPRKKPRMRAHFIPIDQGYKMQPLAGFFYAVESGFRVVYLWEIVDFPFKTAPHLSSLPCTTSLNTTSPILWIPYLLATNGRNRRVARRDTEFLGLRNMSDRAS